MRHRWGWEFVLLASLCASAARGQSLNIAFGAGSPPTDLYGAAGLAGRWNEVGVLPAYQRAPLVDLAGAPIAAQIYMVAATATLHASPAGLSGDDAALMDNMLLGHNDPTDECFWIENLVDGDYEVLMYAMTPNDSTLMTRVRVDNGTPGPTYVGGGWPGHQAAGITYQRFTVASFGGLVAFHAGLAGAYVQSGVNGVQFRLISPAAVTPTGAADPTQFEIGPNPWRAGEPLQWSNPRSAAGGRVTVLDVTGRSVWSAPVPVEGRSHWDGHDQEGHDVPSGVYVMRWSTPEGRLLARRRIVRID